MPLLWHRGQILRERSCIFPIIEPRSHAIISRRVIWNTRMNIFSISKKYNVQKLQWLAAVYSSWHIRWKCNFSCQFVLPMRMDFPPNLNNAFSPFPSQQILKPLCFVHTKMQFDIQNSTNLKKYYTAWWRILATFMTEKMGSYFIVCNPLFCFCPQPY